MTAKFSVKGGREEISEHLADGRHPRRREARCSGASLGLAPCGGRRPFSGGRRS
jgi:hypothetical protein